METHEPIKSLTEFVDKVIKLRKARWSRSSHLFFRGASDKNYPLEPSVFRDSAAKSKERKLFLEFQLKAPTHGIEYSHKEVSRWLVDMQHYGVHTRLLDWSLSPLIALYFAVKEVDKKTNAAVHVLNPSQLLQFSRKKKEVSWLTVTSNHVDARARLIISDERRIKNEFEEYKNLRMLHPVPFFAQQSNPRLIAQSGCFTIHGLNKTPIDQIDEVVVINKKPLSRDNFYEKLIIDGNSKRSILRDLQNMNINEYTVFPDLYGLANKMKSETL